MSTKTLIQIQEQAIEEILALPQQGKRAAGYGVTLLNRPPRSLRAIHRVFDREAQLYAGLREDQLSQAWKDLTDIAKLQASAE